MVCQVLLESGNFIISFNLKKETNSCRCLQANCKCIISHESGGNGNAVNYNGGQSSAYLWDVGLWQINSYNWNACSGGSAPCDPNKNLQCGEWNHISFLIHHAYPFYYSHWCVQVGWQHLEALVHLRCMRCLQLPLNSYSLLWHWLVSLFSDSNALPLLSAFYQLSLIPPITSFPAFVCFYAINIVEIAYLSKLLPLYYNHHRS